jgi:hypothetical protein
MPDKDRYVRAGRQVDSNPVVGDCSHVILSQALANLSCANPHNAVAAPQIPRSISPKYLDGESALLDTVGVTAECTGDDVLNEILTTLASAKCGAGQNRS